LDRLAAVLGEEAVRPVISQVEDECRKRVGDRRWEIFRDGNEEERDRLLEEAIRGVEPNGIVAEDIPRPGATATSDGCGEQRLQTKESQS
jgi:hypothetical protein